MNKSILIIDTPKNCEKCKCLYPSYKDDCLYDCAITGKRVPIRGMVFQEKPNWCPLKQMPKKLAEENRWFSKDYATGFNACIDEIVKERDENE